MIRLLSTGAMLLAGGTVLAFAPRFAASKPDLNPDTHSPLAHASTEDACGADCAHVHRAGCKPAAPLVIELEAGGRDGAGRASILWSATPLVDLVALEVSTELPTSGRLRYSRGERAERIARGARAEGELGLDLPADSRVDLVFLATFVDPQSSTGTSTARIDRRVEYGAPQDEIDAVLAEADGELLLIAPSTHRPAGHSPSGTNGEDR